MNLIVAVDEAWGIGKSGNLLFHIKHDMKFFRETTTGNVVVMGRKTLDSFPNGAPLKNRTNIVLTKDTDFKRDGVTKCNTIYELLDEIKKYDSEKVFVIGGEQIYKLLLPYCDTAYITKIHAKKDSDAFMVNLDTDTNWEIREKSQTFNENGIDFTFCTYKRI